MTHLTVWQHPQQVKDEELFTSLLALAHPASSAKSPHRLASNHGNVVKVAHKELKEECKHVYMIQEIVLHWLHWCSLCLCVAAFAPLSLDLDDTKMQ